MAAEILAEAEDQVRWFHRGPVPANTTPLMKVVIVKSDPREVFTVLEDPAVRGTINDQNAKGMTALMYAAESGKGDIAMELAKAGANAKLKNKDGKDAIDLLKALPLEQFDEDPAAAVQMRTKIVDAIEGRAGGKRKRFSTKRKSKRNVRRVRYSRRRA